MNSKLPLLLVDDSAFYRRRNTDYLGQEPAIAVVGTATDGLAAVNPTQRLKPDVISMDVEWAGLSERTPPLEEIGPMLFRSV